MTNADLLLALSQGDYPDFTRSAINANRSIDQFFADLAAIRCREVVNLPAALELTAGEILYRSISATPGAAGSNAGNGTLSIDSIGLYPVDGVYKLTCATARVNGGIFEFCDPDGSLLAMVNVGTPLKSDHLNLTVADGSNDFEVGDVFTVTVSGTGDYAPYDFTSTDEQVASAILAVDVDTSTTTQQFANANGPTILNGSFLRVRSFVDADAAGVTMAQYNDIINRSVQQLANRGIVLRGDVALIHPN